MQTPYPCVANDSRSWNTSIFGTRTHGDSSANYLNFRVGRGSRVAAASLTLSAWILQCTSPKTNTMSALLKSFLISKTDPDVDHAILSCRCRSVGLGLGVPGLVAGRGGWQPARTSEDTVPCPSRRRRDQAAAGTDWDSDSESGP